jgi:exopolysaccharide biosynthesis polyprenyl glycosylphosphotransferase
VYRKPTKGWIKHLDFIVFDLICLQIAFVLAFWYRFGKGQNPYSQELYASIIIMMSVFDILVAVLFSSYSGILQRNWFRQIFTGLRHSFIVLAAVTVYLFATKSSVTYSRILIILTAVLHFIITFIVDILYKAIRWGKKDNSKSLFVISTYTEIGKAIRSIQNDKRGNIIIKGVAILDRDMTGELIQDIPVVANRETIDDFILRDWVDEVYVRLPQDDEINEVVFSSLREMGVTIHIDATAYQSLSGCDFVMEKIGDSLVITTSMKMMPAWQLTIKRLVDIIGGFVGTVIMLLMAVCIAPFIWNKSPGPLFFTQERIGRNGKRFKIYKFRSMYMDAEERKAALVQATGQEGRLMFKMDDDPRIIGSEKKGKDGTPKGIGNFIRQTSIDEFPQFWNVLKGEMSLVGTRPPTIDEWARYDLRHRARMSTKPGITGLWQVSGRSDIIDFEEVVRLDTKYITEWSLKLDFQILCKTVAVVLGHKGAR